MELETLVKTLKTAKKERQRTALFVGYGAWVCLNPMAGREPISVRALLNHARMRMQNYISLRDWKGEQPRNDAPDLRWIPPIPPISGAATE